MTKLMILGAVSRVTGVRIMHMCGRHQRDKARAWAHKLACWALYRWGLMNDSMIARFMRLERSTICKHRRDVLRVRDQAALDTARMLERIIDRCQ